MRPRFESLPRFAAEPIPDAQLDADDIGGFSIATPFGRTLCRIEWYDSMETLTDEEARCLESRWPVSLAAAIRHHNAVSSPA